MSAKKTVAIIALLGTIAIGGGIGTGFLLHEFFAPVQEIDYENLKGGQDTDVEALLAKYEAFKKDGTPLTTSLAPHEFVQISYALFAKEEHVQVTSRGLGIAAGGIANQEIWARSIKDGAQAFEESCSASGIVKIAARMYETEGNTTYYFTGNAYPGSPSFENYERDKGVTVTNDEYFQKMGKYVSSSNIYVIDESTSVLNGEPNRANTNSGTPTSVVKTDAGYRIDIELDNVYGVRNYVRQMKTISNLAQYPSFYYVHLSWDLDENLMPLEMRSHENYYAKTSSGVGSKIESNMTVTYEYGGSYQIPDLLEPLNYR